MGETPTRSLRMAALFSKLQPVGTIQTWSSRSWRAAPTPITAGRAASAPSSSQPGRNTEILRMLVAAGADPNRVTDKFRYSPLGSSAGSRPDTFVRLRASGAYRGSAPNSPESVRILLRAGANPNHVDTFNESPLRTAMRVNNLKIASLLLEAGADVHQRVDDSTSIGEQRGNTILMNTIWWHSLFKDANSVRLLLNHKANPNDRSELEYDAECDATTSGKCSWRGYTALTYAAKNGMTAVVRLLLQHGADLTIARSDGKTALDLALEHNHPATAQILRQYAKRKPARQAP